MNTRPNLDRVPALVAAGPDEARLGILFRRARKASGKTIAQTAKALACSINPIRWHESGTRMLRLDDVARAAALFGCDIAMIVKDNSAETDAS